MTPMDLRTSPGPPRPRILVTGFGAGGFGAAVARGLAAGPPLADVIDVPANGLDLACALRRGYDGAILVTAAPRGAPPGTLTVLEPLDPRTDGRRSRPGEPDPVEALRPVGELGRLPGRVLLVCREPGQETTAHETPAERTAAVDEAIRLVRSLVTAMIAERG
ncbi:hydrogenase maturation protease [Nonomuraea sp. NN258]|uniref:hydrogenase maturation protease n=1 Tax=Nonomuraea antri TaxID=2730852 RepID=UPI001569CE25|nr:hydrogenase maturation protease [Nonomuraea antri]NRQ38949.1 hydrogenase maturation protease [Nonomuraea antri]